MVASAPISSASPLLLEEEDGANGRPTSAPTWDSTSEREEATIGGGGQWGRGWIIGCCDGIGLVELRDGEKLFCVSEMNGGWAAKRGGGGGEEGGLGSGVG
ncbi:unnamed protein product [Prunus armeniaca]|uniref:Uncharacterized protein n=1 Tax=Prunus armeniaca TaxID=36596 RepID=A0A6J5VVG6_PRUAR|nr:unnamed protein product [Prunus armeniaca]